PLADAAFFVDACRPVTQMRLRWDSGFDLQNPDRAEFFWARPKTNPGPVSPNCRGQNDPRPGKGPQGLARTVDHLDLRLYMEGATARFGLFVETSYLHVDPEVSSVAPLIGRSPANPGNPAGSSLQNLPQPASGFGDLVIGTKALLLDSELLQITFQFKTFILTGNFTRGLGTGHVSLEPSLMGAMCLAAENYLQAKI